MIQHQLYEAIFKRKSIRKYKGPVDAPVLEEIRSFLQKVKPVGEQSLTHWELLESGQVGGLGVLNAPHFAVVYSTGDVIGRIDAGFQMQQLDLYLSARGMGACYQGMAKPTPALRKVDNKPYAMMLAFGKADGPVHRVNGEGFVRKTMEQIAGPGLDEGLLEAVRLAPSAINNQPWFFTGDNRSLEVWKVRTPGVKSLFTGTMSDVDMGIALQYLSLSAAERGMALRFEQGGSVSTQGDRNRTFVGLARLG